VNVSQVLSILLVLGLPWTSLMRRAVVGPDTIVVHSGTLSLRGLVWRPQGPEPFPAILFNHGSGHASGKAADGMLDQRHPEVLGPIFARHGYVFLYLYRRGDGLSRGEGQASGDAMDREMARHGQEGRNRTQVWLLDNLELRDALSGLRVLRSLPGVDKRRVAVVGHSFGGSLSLLLVERDPALRAAVVFSGAGKSWDDSPPLRARLLAAVSQSKAPVFFIHATNDYSVEPGKVLDAEMARLGKPHQLKIYPRVGRTAEDGHSLVYRAVPRWEQDVFAFLDRWTR
jgi:carboxymethylenebutenolidase